MAPAAILSASRTRQVPRMAPRILLSSKEFIAIGLRGALGSDVGLAPRSAAAAIRYRFASAVATRISAAPASPFVTEAGDGIFHVRYHRPDPRASRLDPPARQTAGRYRRGAHDRACPAPRAGGQARRDGRGH